MSVKQDSKNVSQECQVRVSPKSVKYEVPSKKCVLQRVARKSVKQEVSYKSVK